MKLRHFKFYFHFYKSTLLLNWVLSFVAGLLSQSVKVFALTSCTAGFVLACYYFEVTQKNQYYFYYNAGISKYQLLLFSFLLNFIVALLIIFTSIWL